MKVYDCPVCGKVHPVVDYEIPGGSQEAVVCQKVGGGAFYFGVFSAVRKSRPDDVFADDALSEEYRKAA